MRWPCSTAPVIIAHRGLSGHAPENTAAAIRAAAHAGVSWVELDVSQLGDATLVIWHDDDLRRCSDGQGRLDRLTWRDVAHLDCGSWFSSQFRGEKMLTLERALRLLKALELGVNLELKAYANDPGDYIDAIEEHLLRVGFDNRQLLLSSFQSDLLTRMQRRSPQRPLGLLTEAIAAETWALAEALEVSAIVAECSSLLPEQVIRARRSGYRMITYTANQPHRIASLIESGISGVITDYPERYPSGTTSWDG